MNKKLARLALCWALALAGLALAGMAIWANGWDILRFALSSLVVLSLAVGIASANTPTRSDRYPRG